MFMFMCMYLLHVLKHENGKLVESTLSIMLSIFISFDEANILLVVALTDLMIIC
jgi:hypothetical protein